MAPGASRPYRRQLSITRFSARRLFLYVTGALVVAACVSALAKLAANLTRGSEQHAIPEEIPGEPIPLGQSRDRGGREVFWWEQFPRLNGFYNGRRKLVTLSHYVSEQDRESPEPERDSTPLLAPVRAQVKHDGKKCFADEEETLEIPQWSAYNGLPQRMSAPLLGSAEVLDLDNARCYDRVERLGPYGNAPVETEQSVAYAPGGDNADGPSRHPEWSRAKWSPAQDKCYEKNRDVVKSRTAFIIRTWAGYKYTRYDIAVLRAIVSEIALASRGKYTVHFLVHLQDDSIPIWASEEEYNRVLQSSIPMEFHGMATLWSVAQMKLIYPPPFPESIVNFSGGDVYEAYRSLHFPLQYFAEKHPEFDYFWQWEMDIRVTGHYHELLEQISAWAEKQPQEYSWELSSRFYIPALHGTYDEYVQTIKNEMAEQSMAPIAGPQLPKADLVDTPEQANPPHADHITDLITFNPLFDPTGTKWAFHDDITGYDERPPTRAALITASRMSRRLLRLMHKETYARNHTMFPEMYPASIALQYGLKAIYAPLPIYFDRDWPPVHANEVFNNAELSDDSKGAGMDHGDGHFHGKGGSVFGPGEHVFRGATYYSNAAFASYLWKRWLGRENDNEELKWESQNKQDGGRMCLPMMVLHPIKQE
ncbi:uncharacterized protein AB675_7939 [Cyphellophora attinorum]|uniref:Uncharacterized protein n=1 Tax=Cyphellophora attinorum TaxID=1664694 RepID=A0A0N1HC23_9EURO|nr:uncharacterized protein AB675_7939 [Phialophora attinorum]KPI41162.1 hypothetical protein AB675_7939 [Phialophora attinorum]